MLKRLHDWTMALAARKTVEAWFAVIAFIRSSVFLVPADVLLLPIALAKPAYAYRFALMATIASSGIAGYFLGLIAAIAAALLIGLYVLVKYSGTAGTVTSC
jgi:membrane protein YqaA with SNARE-associated domain